MLFSFLKLKVKHLITKCLVTHNFSTMNVMSQNSVWHFDLGWPAKLWNLRYFCLQLRMAFFEMFQMLSKLESMFNVSRTDDVLFLNLIHIVTFYPCYTGLSKKCFKKDMMCRFPKHAILANVRTSNGQLIIKILFNFDRVQFSVNEYRNSRNTQQTSRRDHCHI